MDKSEFIDYTPIDKAQLMGIPEFSINVFMNPKNNRWMFELVDNNDMSLKSLNQGKLYYLPYYCNMTSDFVYSKVCGMLPNSEVIIYPSMEAWCECCHSEMK